MKDKNKSILADLSMLVIAIIWGSSFVIIKDSLSVISPMWLIATRFVIATAAALIIFAPRLKKMTLKCFGSGFMTGVLIYAAFIAQTYGAKYTTASKNALLTATYVVLVPFIVWLARRKRPGALRIVTAISCFVGVAMLTLNNGFGSINIGDLLTLAGGVLFAVHIVVLDFVTEKHDPLLLSLMQLAGSAVSGVVCALIFDFGGFQNVFSTGKSTFSVFYLGLLSTFLAYVVQTTAQKYTAPSHASLILSLECVLGCVFSMLYFKDSFTPLMWCGCVLAIGSVFVSEAADNMKPKRPKTKANKKS